MIIKPEDLKAQLSEHILIDVREPDEFQFCAIEGSQNIPLLKLKTMVVDDEVLEPFASLPKNAAIVTICHHGVRSMTALHILSSLGFENIQSLKGGVDLWAKAIDTSMKTY